MEASASEGTSRAANGLVLPVAGTFRNRVGAVRTAATLALGVSYSAAQLRALMYASERRERARLICVGEETDPRRYLRNPAHPANRAQPVLIGWVSTGQLRQCTSLPLCPLCVGSSHRSPITEYCGLFHSVRTIMFLATHVYA